MYFVNNEALAKKCIEKISDSIAKESFLAVDTEFIRESYEEPFLCLLQVASVDDIFLFDPFKIDIKCLAGIFSDGKILKIFHSASQDLEALRCVGVEVNNYYDTQLYEMLLDTKENVNYAYLVQKYVGVKIKKDCTLSNWRARPLSRKQKKYASNDVFYLIEIYLKQSQKLQELERADWLCDYLLKRDEPFNSEIFEKLKSWCEQKAFSLGIEPNEIASLDTIKSICKKGSSFVSSLKSSRHEKTLEFSEFLKFAESVTIPVKVSAEKNYNKAILKLLQALLLYCSRLYNIAPSLIASQKDLIDFLVSKEDSEITVGWRREVFGKYALKLLCGNLSLRIEGENVKIDESDLSSNEKDNADFAQAASSALCASGWGKTSVVQKDLAQDASTAGSAHMVRKTDNVFALSAALKHLSLALKYTRPKNDEFSSQDVIILEEDLNVAAKLTLTAKDFLEGIDLFNLDAIVCAAGPGSFTGLRAVHSFVKAFSLATGTRALSVEYFDVIRKIYKDRFCANFKIELITIQNEKNQIYFKIFDDGKALQSGVSDLKNFKKILEPFESVNLIGEMTSEIKNLMPEKVHEIFEIKDFYEAKHLIAFADQDLKVAPLYINVRMNT